MIEIEIGKRYKFSVTRGIAGKCEHNISVMLVNNENGIMIGSYDKQIELSGLVYNIYKSTVNIYLVYLCDLNYIDDL